jgi:hypothetical protein
MMRFGNYPFVGGTRPGRGENDTSDNNPDNSAVMLYKQHVRVEESRRSVDTSQMVSVMPKED